MSLLDDVSIVVTPNGYKAGELYAVIPVPTEGADLVTDGDFSSGSNWYEGTGCTISGGKAIWTSAPSGSGFTGNNLNAGICTIGKRYTVVFTIDSISLGALKIRKPFNSSTTYTQTGTYTETFIATDVDIYIQNSGTTTASISNISVKEYTASDMDVTRATAATRVDENGLVNYAEVLGSDLVTNGDFTTDLSGWSGQAGRGSYAWDNGRAKITNDDASSYPNLSQSITTVVGKVYKITATVEIGTATLIEVRAYSNSNIGSKQLTTDGTIEFYITADDTDFTLHLYLFETGNTGHYCYFDNVSVKEADLNNVPRIDYTGGGCPHILAEPQRTNLVTYSEDFSQWSNFRSTLTPNETTSPDGTINAYLVEQDYPNTSVHGGLNKSIAVTNGVEYTYSFFVKKKEYSFIELAEAATSSGNVSTWFDVENGVVGNIGAGSTAQIEDYGNGWYRCSITFTSAFTGGRNFVLYLSSANGSSTANIVGGAYIWGAQLEAGSYPASYILTSGGSVTRNQDIFSRDGISSLINSTEGVLFVEMAAFSDDLTYRILSLSDGTPNERVYIQYTNVSNTISAVVKNGGSTQFNKTYVLSDETAFSKIAVKWKLNDFALWVDGVERGTDTSGNPPSGLNRLAFDNADITNFFGKVKQLQVFKTALSDSELATLTT